MSKQPNNKVKDYTATTIEQAIAWVNHNCTIENRRRLRSRAVAKVLMDEIIHLRMRLKISIWKHDCQDCRFLGYTHHFGSDFDLYYCPLQNDQVELIARFSNDPKDCITGRMGATEGNAVLSIAAKLYEKLSEVEYS